MSRHEKELERELADLRRRLGRLEDRPASVQPARYTRLAKTVKDPVGEDYPAAGASDTFWIVFLDGTYTAGVDTDQSPSYTVRQAVDDAQVTAHNLSGGWVAEGTVVEVTFHPGVGQAGQWWFSSAESSAWHWAKLDGALAFDGTATASVWDDAPLVDTTDNLTVYPPPVMTSGSIASGTWVRIDLHRNGRWYVIVAECP